MRAVNLLPRDESKRRRKAPGIVGQIALVTPFLVGALVVAGYLMAGAKVKDARDSLQALQEELAALPQPGAQPDAGSRLALQRSQRIAALGTALGNRVAWDRILREISSVLPEDVWLTKLSASSPQAAPPPPPAPADTTTTDSTTTDTSTDSTTTTTTPAPVAAPAPLNLTGYTYSQAAVARLLTRLSVIPDLDDVKLIQSVQAVVTGQTVVSFSIQANVRGPGAA
jgi:Tfp pilus assembly protein PilN